MEVVAAAEEVEVAEVGAVGILTMGPIPPREGCVVVWRLTSLTTAAGGQQSYEVNDNVLYQDNKSAMLLERNNKTSSSKRTKHNNIRYFFITDRITKGEVSIEWCPTTEMVGDYMSKPLQGALFKKFRDIIMGITEAVKSKNKRK